MTGNTAQLAVKANASQKDSSSNKKQGSFFKPFIQPKLSINQPNDMYEQEADAVADKVMRMPDPFATNNLFFRPGVSSIQRKCAECEEEEKRMQRKENNAESVAPTMQTENYINSLSGGRSLKENEKSFFETRMNQDFSDVKIHTDAAAVKSASSMNALAYTTGNNIVFNEGQFAPDTDSGKRLLGHELTHVVQQKGSISIQRQSPPVVAAPAATPTIPGEFAITGASTSSADHTIFFDRNGNTINTQESTKILFLAGPPTPISGNIELKGYVSEDEPATLAQDRITAVRNEFNSYTGFTGTFTETPLPPSGQGRIDYRHMRSVEIIEPGSHSQFPNCSTTSSRITCPATTENNFQQGIIEARRKITNADRLLRASPRLPQTDTLLDRFFGRGIPGNGAAVLSTLLSNMDLIRQQIWRIRNASHHPCANVCDAACAAGAIAYNSDTGFASAYTICPAFSTLDEPNRIRNIIHECAHATPNLSRGSGPLVAGTDDFAYRHERLINILDPSVALVNSDSYSLLIMFLNDPAFATQRPANDNTAAITDPAERPHVEVGIANLEKWLTFAQQETASLYDVIKRSKPPATAWHNTYYEVTMTIWSSNMSELTVPPALPNDTDQMLVAGIHDRVRAMMVRSKSDLVFTRLPANTLWQINLGANVSMGDDFFSASNPEAKALVLLAAIVHSNLEIPTAREPAYVDSINRIRQRH